jgi:hypothetical protein
LLQSPAPAALDVVEVGSACGGAADVISAPGVASWLCPPPVLGRPHAMALRASDKMANLTYVHGLKLRIVNS